MTNVATIALINALHSQAQMSVWQAHRGTNTEDGPEDVVAERRGRLQAAIEWRDSLEAQRRHIKINTKDGGLSEAREALARVKVPAFAKEAAE